MEIYLDGAFVPKEDAKISVFDHGVLYGDGVFEGIRLYDGCIFKLQEHLERLDKSARAILLDLPLTLEEIGEATCEACRRNGLKDGYIRLVVTRGVGDLGLAHTKCPKATIFIIADKITLYPESYYTEGLKIITAPTRRINPAALPPTIKSLNYLNNILAKAEAIQGGVLEALMLNDQGFVAECTGDNVFIRHGETWITPPDYNGALKGITRAAVLEIMDAQGLAYEERPITRFECWTADEMFLTGTAAEVIPVIEVDGRKIGDGTPGTVTGTLRTAFGELARRDGTMI